MTTNRSADLSNGRRQKLRSGILVLCTAGLLGLGGFLSTPVFKNRSDLKSTHPAEGSTLTPFFSENRTLTDRIESTNAKSEQLGILKVPASSLAENFVALSTEAKNRPADSAPAPAPQNTTRAIEPPVAMFRFSSAASKDTSDKKIRSRVDPLAAASSDGLTELSGHSSQRQDVVLAKRKTLRALSRERLPQEVDFFDGAASDRPLLERSESSLSFTPETEAVQNPFSTFSLNVSDVSFQTAAASLAAGTLPTPSSIRVEEFLNAFDFSDPIPSQSPIGLTSERTQHPWTHGRELLRISVRTAAEGRVSARPLRLTLLIDHSGSMVRADRSRILSECLSQLAGHLTAHDRVSIVLFARTARLWRDQIPGDQISSIASDFSQLTPEGGTNLEEALKLGYQTAARQLQAQAINRMLLFTDGAANLGNADADDLRKMTAARRLQGIALDCFGVGWDGLNDPLLEALARNGDGRYRFLNSPEDASTGFSSQLTGALRVAASDLKVQVEFNPSRVRHWRLMGFDKHQLTAEQFRDNKVDGAELGAAEAGNAVYAAEMDRNGQGPIGVARIRFKNPDTGEVSEREWEIPWTGPATSFASASPAMRLAAVSVCFAERLTGSPHATGFDSAQAVRSLHSVLDAFGPDSRPRQLHQMLERFQSMAVR